MVNAIAISSPSGVGKATISKLLMLCDPDLYAVVGSATTRKPKEEVHGKKYIHPSYEEFEELITSGGFLEYNKYPSKCDRGFHYYGSLKSSYEANIAAKKISLFDIEQNGLIQLKQALGSSLYSFGLMAEEDEILKRLKGRNAEEWGDILARWETGKMELKKIPMLQAQGVIDEVVWYGAGAHRELTANQIHNTVLQKIQPKRIAF